MRTGVVTDSSGWHGTPLPRHMRVVDIGINLVSGDWNDSAIDPALVQHALLTQEPVKTRAPTVIDYLTAIEDDEFDEAVVLTPAVTFTTMWKNARHAADLADRPCAVVDTRTATAGQQLVAERVVAAAADGASLADIVATAELTAARVRMVAFLGSGDAIASSGVLPGAIDGSLFRFTGAVIEPLATTRRRPEPVRSLVDAWEREGGPDGDPALVFAAGAGDVARQVAAAVGARAVGGVSPAVIAHTGPVVVGLAWVSAGL